MSVIKHKQWSQVNMEAAFQYVKEQRGSLREASGLHGVPVETLRRRVNGMVDIDCKPGPSTNFASEEKISL